MAKRYHIYILLVIMGASIYTSAMVSPYNAAAITTLDRLESESSILRQDNLHFDVKLKNPEDIAVDQNDNIIYVANNGSDTVSVINGTGGNYINIKNITFGDSPRSIAVDHGGYGELNNIVYVANDDIADKDPGTVSVINGTGGNYRNIANNTVGNGPIDIAIRKSPYGTYIYVLNSG